MRKLILLASLSLSSCLSCTPESYEKDEVVERFGQKFANLKKTIHITEPGVYDYEKVMHKWTGGGSCNYFSDKPAAMVISADHVEIKNLGIKGAVRGIVIEGQRHVTFDNVEVFACYEALEGDRTKVTIQNNSLFTVRD